MMGLFAVTGASGFIGQEVCRRLRDAGEDVIALGRSGTGEGWGQWALGEPLPEACRAAGTVVHLASATLGVSGALRTAAIETDVSGTRVLIEQLRGWRRGGSRHRLIFVSSQSARPEAVNAYGRSKWAIEQLLAEDDEIVLRPGLVYSEPPQSVFAMFDKLSRLPALPAFDGPPSIQPVHVREVADAIVRAGAMKRPPRLLMLGAVAPLTFADAIRATARRCGRRAPTMLPIPMQPVRLAANLVDRMLGATLTERLDGLAGLQPIDTAPSLAALDQTLASF
ncbi:MAG: NAD-dependent epimerase/dehydratase family protein [Janthinobacterium lividum]